MNTFEWENGTIIERPYIEVDGEKHYIEDGEISGGTPVTANNLNEMQTILGGNFQLKGKLLWTNSSPGSTFAPQTITLNSDDYDCYEIIFRFTKDINRTNSTGKILKGTGTTCTYAVGGNYYRTINYASDTSLNVSAGQVITTFGGTPNTDNSWCIPLYVIGYKTGLFS